MFKWIICLLLLAVVICSSADTQDGKSGQTTPSYLQHDNQIGSCLTDLIRVVCTAIMEELPMRKRRNELINNILGLPRVLQDIGK